MEKDIAYKEARKRGWFSYTELSCLMNSMQLIEVAHAVVNISTICLAAYTAGIVTLLGSALVASYFPGSVLSPRQTRNSTDIMQTDVHPIIDETSSPVEILAENILTTDLLSASLSCNQSEEKCEYIGTSEDANADWKWWLNSMMIWLPEYSGLESESPLHVVNDETEHADRLMTTKFLMDTTTSNDLLSMNWKQILDIDLKILVHDWRYYANYVTKITLDHQH